MEILRLAGRGIFQTCVRLRPMWALVLTIVILLGAGCVRRQPAPFTDEYFEKRHGNRVAFVENPPRVQRMSDDPAEIDRIALRAENRLDHRDRLVMERQNRAQAFWDFERRRRLAMERRAAELAAQREQFREQFRRLEERIGS